MILMCPNCRFIHNPELYICPECGMIRCNSQNCLRLFDNTFAHEGDLCPVCAKGRWKKVQPQNPSSAEH
ncbi:MAG: hypothetical protein RRY29_05120, partial [Desulfovibrionaceae bacterium]